jgi:hypothetical protein
MRSVSWRSIRLEYNVSTQIPSRKMASVKRVTLDLSDQVSKNFQSMRILADDVVVQPGVRLLIENLKL